MYCYVTHDVRRVCHVTRNLNGDLQALKRCVLTKTATGCLVCAVFNVKSAWRQQGITLQGSAFLKDFVSSQSILLVKESELEMLQLTNVLDEVM